ncbi:hypothetical protein M3616_23110, partial [Bacillus velezensis]|nr:hypothetical protein [Bacillus velezensis]
VSLIAGYGLLAFRDPFGIRPLCIGKLETEHGTEWMVASESVAVEGIGFEFVRDLEPGEAIFIDKAGNFHSQQCAENPTLNPCMFEYVYLARPESCLDRVPFYNVRLRMGDSLAETSKRELPNGPAIRLETWVVMHEDLRASPRCRAVFDALANGLRA